MIIRPPRCVSTGNFPSCTILAIHVFISIILSLPVNGQKFPHSEHPRPETEQIPLNDSELRQQMQEGGLPPKVIDKLVAQHRLWNENGGNSSWMHVRPASPPGVAQAPCNAMGVENGWGAWMGMEGNNYNVDTLNYVITWNSPGSPAAQTLFGLTGGTGNDPNTPGPNPGDPTIPVVCPGFGSNSILLNPNCEINFACAQLTYPMTVTSADVNFVYAYALVIQDGNNNGGQPHTSTNQPYVQFFILDANGDTVTCSDQYYVGGVGSQGFYEVNGLDCADPGDLYKPWTLVGINLSSYVGQTLTVVINNVDCSMGGHFVKSYWDFLCGTSTLTAGCAGSQSTVCGPSDPNISYSYQWYLNNNPIPGGNQQCITITPAQGDTIRVTVTDPQGCGFNVAYTPEVNTPAFTSTGICNPISFNGSTSGNGTAVPVSWNWSFPGGTPSNANTQNVNVSYPGPGNYQATLTVSYSNGCTATSTQTATVSSGGVSASFTTDSLCDGKPFTFTDQSVFTPGDPIVSRTWSLAGGTPSTGNSPSMTVTYPPGSYTAQLSVITSGGCSSSVSKPVVVYNNPSAAFIPPALSCSPLCHTFIDNSTSVDGAINRWVWTFQGGTPPSSNLQQPTVCWNTPGSFGVGLIVESAYGCSDTLTLPAAVQTIPAPNATINGTARVCLNASPPLVTLLGSNGSGPYTFDYTINGTPAQVVSNQNGTAQIPISTATPGTQTIQLTGITSSGNPPCYSPVNQKVEVTIEATPQADFMAEPIGCPYSATIDFRNQSLDGDSYLWQFGDGTISTEPNPEHYYPLGDDYTVDLLAVSALGCRDSIRKTVSVSQDFRIWYPNAFTPNGDNKNETFYPEWISANEIRFSIYNRWGHLIYMTEELGQGWDGTFNGAPAEEATYVFRVEAADLCERKVSYTGKFYLVR